VRGASYKTFDFVFGGNGVSDLGILGERRGRLHREQRR
jgi:hypothetical protein